DLSGSIWWAMMALIALPFKLIGSEQGIIISVRILLLLLPTLGTFYLSYKILRDFVKNRFSMALLYIILAFSFYTAVNITSVFFTFPEPMYGFFLMLSFYFLYKADNQFNRYFYYSIMAYGVSVSIKMVGLLYGVVYVVYFIKNWRKLNVPLVIKTASIWVITLLSLNLILLHPEIWRFFSSNLKDTAFVGRHGFTQYMWFKDFPPSISFFTKDYINIYAFILILVGFIAGSAYVYLKKGINREKYVYFLLAFAVVITYFLYSTFYMFMPHHYGLVLIYFLPFVVFSTMNLSSSRPNIAANIVLTIIFPVLFIGGISYLQKDNTLRAFDSLTLQSVGCNK
ncbi:MAG: hypothetical protein Q8M92_07250, partial [Candidatus Subteraquimicrobiales bacterium]|nr:hypothetical protein [Candidatus Subteraquimicrobiales bacterium]